MDTFAAFATNHALRLPNDCSTPTRPSPTCPRRTPSWFCHKATTVATHSLNGGNLGPSSGSPPGTPSISVPSSETQPASEPRRAFLQLSLATLLNSCVLAVAGHVHSSGAAIAAAPPPPVPPENPKVYLDISIAGQPKGRITIALARDAAPASVDTFAALANGTLRDRTGRTAGYNRSVGSRVVAGKRVYLGRVNQIDALNQSPGTPQRQQRSVAYPANEDRNNLVHDRPGVVSVSKGGSFEFSISATPDPDVDEESTVIGYVVDGMDVVDQLVKVPTNRKTIRDGYRNIGKAIGDPRANVQVSFSVRLVCRLRFHVLVVSQFCFTDVFVSFFLSWFNCCRP